MLKRLKSSIFEKRIIFIIIKNISDISNANIRINDMLESMDNINITKYEKQTGNKVTKFSYVYDKKPQQYATGIKQIGSLTERKLACSWSILQAMNYYCERKFERV